jgi:pilus assembly protein Flp/PilA
MKRILSFLRDTSGASSIEYAMLAIGIAVTIIVTVHNLGATVDQTYNSETAILTSYGAS